MEQRARNQLRGTVRSVTKGHVLSEVVVDIGGQEIVSIIASSSLDLLGLKPGEAVAAIVKSTEVTLGK